MGGMTEAGIGAASPSQVPQTIGLGTCVAAFHLTRPLRSRMTGARPGGQPQECGVSMAHDREGLSIR